MTARIKSFGIIGVLVAIAIFFISRNNKFQWLADEFADVSIFRYQVPGFKQLPLKQKKLLYYLYQAGLSGRDIMFDQNYRHNLRIRRTLEEVVKHYEGDRKTPEFKNFLDYTKLVWFSNGIHHHYSQEKFIPTFSFENLVSFIQSTPQGHFPVREGQSVEELLSELKPIMFDPAVDSKKVNQEADEDQVSTSAINFYTPGLSQKVVEDFYKKAASAQKNVKNSISYGLNSRLVSKDGVIQEETWKVGGLYSAALEKVVYWLKQAQDVAENEQQKEALNLLARFYETGDLKLFDEFSIAWAKETEGKIDFINGFIEVYNDPKGRKGSYESMAQLIDPVATKRMNAIASSAQWFEDNSSILPEHKKEKVTGILGRAVNVVNLSGDSFPACPIGVNLPNSDWIRHEHGSKSVTLSNIIEAYGKKKTGVLEEFSYSKEEVKRGHKYEEIAQAVMVDMHEVIGHASGKINSGVGDPAETLKEYASALEEARADLVALYFIADAQKIVELKIVPSIEEAHEMAKHAYASDLRNALQAQLKRIKPGNNLEEAHMRNRQLIANWVMEKGSAEKVVERKVRDGKTYFVINDYDKLRVLFGDLLKEIQRIKSEGDYQAGKKLVENYGVKVDVEMNKEVLARLEKYKATPYSGLLNPRLVAKVDKNGNMMDVEVEYPKSYIDQMLEYATHYSFLPNEN